MSGQVVRTCPVDILFSERRRCAGRQVHPGGARRPEPGGGRPKLKYKSAAVYFNVEVTKTTYDYFNVEIEYLCKTRELATYCVLLFQR